MTHSVTQSAVRTEHPDYQKFKDKWALVRSVINSEVRDYIRNVDPSDLVRTEQYKNDAQFTNFTNRTRSGLVGQVFRKPPVVEVPAEMAYLKENADGQGTPLVQLLQKSVSEALEVGREMILVEFPPNGAELDAEEAESLQLLPRLKKYSTEALINWATESVGSLIRPKLLVFQEEIMELGEDGFTWSIYEQHRALRLVNGVYVQELYDKNDTLVGTALPVDSEGRSWERLPAHIIGSVNNDLVVDNIPLYDMARLNVGHLNNSADLEENAFIHGQMTLFLDPGDMDTDEFEKNNPEGIKVGARGGHIIGMGGRPHAVQAQPNQLADQLMKRKEEQAVMIGARLITPSAGIETAEAARIRNASENSSLSTIVKNVGMAYTNALKDCARFLGIPGDGIIVELNEEFYEEGIDPNELIASIQLMERGVIAAKDIRDRLRDKGLIDPERDDSSIDADAEPVENVDPIDTDNRL